MFKNKIIYSKKIYKFPLNYFFYRFYRQSKDLGSYPSAVESVIFSTERFSNSLKYFLFYSSKTILWKIQFSRQIIRNTEKMFGNKIIYFNKIYKLPLNYFFYRVFIFSFIHQKRFYENQKFNFSTKIYEISKKCWEKKIVYFKKIYKFDIYYSFYRNYIFSFTRQ